jgi:hypothetical protein
VFTSDLKSFSTYGLAVDTSASSTTGDEAIDVSAGSPTKRKYSGNRADDEDPKQVSDQPPSNLIDTIKKRRRIMRVKYAPCPALGISKLIDSFIRA